MLSDSNAHSLNDRVVCLAHDHKSADSKDKDYIYYTIANGTCTR